MAAAAVAAIATSADIRLPEYGQSSYISNRVDGITAIVSDIENDVRTNSVAAVREDTAMARDAATNSNAKVTAAAADIEAVKALVVGGEAASPYLGGIRVTINTGSGAYVPEGDEYYKALAGAYIGVQLPNEFYKVPVESISAGFVKQIFVPCMDFVDVAVQLHLGPAKRIYNDGAKVVHVRQGQMADVVLNSLPPLDPTSEMAEQLRMVGRAQYYDPANENGKQSTGESFPVQRVWDSERSEWVTQFGYYSNSVWVTQCDIYNLVPQLGSDGGVVNMDEIGDASSSYEAAAYPWCDAKRVAFVFDEEFLHTGGQATPATNVYFFSRVPIYAYKETIETIPVTNFNANGTVASVVNCPLQIKWVARPEITNGYDNAFYIPPWEKIYARDYDEENDIWTTREIGVKEANYYACYKSSPTADKNGNWRMAGNNNYTIQSYPWSYRDGSNYGVFGISRGVLNTYSHKLNPYGFTVHNADGISIGAATAYFPPATNNADMAQRRWAGNNWHDYEAFRVLAYIQFSANAQSAAQFRAKDGKNHITGIHGINTTSVLESSQDALEAYREAQPVLHTFTIGPSTSSTLPFQWLDILNFWGSEGDQMCDVTTVAQTDADNTKSIWYLANLDHSRLIPDSSGAGTNYDLFTGNGYEKLSYYWAYTGLSGTYYRGKDQKAQYAAFGLVKTTPTAADELFSYNMNSSAYDGIYAPSSYPSQPGGGSNMSYWMCSLSFLRNYAIGPWYVYSAYGPSLAVGNNWGGRASPNLLVAEREARSE